MFQIWGQQAQLGSPRGFAEGFVGVLRGEVGGAAKLEVVLRWLVVEELGDPPFLGVLISRGLLVWVCISAPEFWNLPDVQIYWLAIWEFMGVVGGPQTVCRRYI